MAFDTRMKFNGMFMLVTVILLSSSLALIGASRSDMGSGERDLPKPNEYQKIIIRNSLGGGVWAGVHCKSRDDDLGRRYLPPNKTYNITNFNANIWQTTLFYCHVTWKWPGNSQSHYFDAYRYKREVRYCGPGLHPCCWDIKPSGPCTCVDKSVCLDWK